MNTQRSLLLAGLAVAAGSFFALSAAQAQAEADDAPMPTDAQFDPNPTDRDKAKIKALLVYEWDPDGNRVPVKTFKITNNSPITVYPVMRDANEAALGTSDQSNVGLYDPYDPVRTEFRGYIGYRGKDTKYYFGLKRGESILVRVPLVFWNGARMGIVTDGKYLTPAPDKPNPLHYNPGALKIITNAEIDKSDSSLIPNGVVMWYRAPLGAPALDSPDQLIEWTIRDKDYLSSAAITQKTKGEIPDSEKVTLINYDVSYVDNMFLPVAMEGLDVPVPAPKYPPGKNPQPFGWIGAVNTINDLQGKIQAFTAPNNTILGSYFPGGKGWPYYNIPKGAVDGFKIPAGQNIFAQSPMAGTPSSYDVNQYMLSSNGGTPIKFNIGGFGKASSGDILTLSPLANRDNLKMLKPGLIVVGNTPKTTDPNPIQTGTKVLEVLHIGTGDNDPTTVRLDKPLVASQDGCTFDFYPPVDDYAANAMIKLWYSWAKYYLEKTKGLPSRTVGGAVANLSATLTFSSPQAGLVEGMQVTGPGLAGPDAGKGRGGIVILAIAEDQKSVTLSQLATEDHPMNESKSYTIAAPQPLPSTPDSLYDLTFTGDPDPARVPDEFARKVYLAMASMAQIPKDPKVKAPQVCELMNNVIGGNVGFIFDTSDDQAANNKRRFSDAGLEISGVIRDIIKSVLRGVTDFTKFPEHDKDGKLVWYPDPKVRTSNQSFNVFNLDPFVWFVHVQLKFSGYGFSLDDDTADVGAGQATKMHITIGGKDHLPNQEEWTIQAPYGPVTGGGNWDPDQQQSFYLGITDATNASPIVITSEKHGLANGEEVTIDEVRGNFAANGKFKVANVTKNTFELAGSKGNGAYGGGGRWTTGPLYFITGVDLLNVYWKLKGDDRTAGFEGALVSGPGVPVKGTIRIKKLGNDQQGQLGLNAQLTTADGKPLPKGYYQWTFSGK